MNIDKMLRKYEIKAESSKPDEAALSSTILKAKEAFWIGEAENNLAWHEFLYQQLLYMRKIWWLLQSILLLFLWVLMKTADSGPYIERCMGILAPIFTILILPELWKSISNQSMEIEGTALFSLQKIMAARMILFAMVDLVFLTIFMIASVASAEISIMNMVVQFLLPMTVTGCICLRIFSGKVIRGIIPSIIACLMWLTVWTLVVLRDDVYQKVATPIWVVLFIMAVIYICYCFLRIIKETENIVSYSLLGDI